MADVYNSATMTMAYKNTDFTRTYTFSGISAASLSGIESAIVAVNTSLAAGTDDGLSDFFRADDYDSANNIGQLSKISKVKIESVEEVYIFKGSD